MSATSKGRGAGESAVIDSGMEGKRRNAYMFLSFNPLVSLLDGIQVLKMQLHQSIDLERERKNKKLREADRVSERERDAARKEVTVKMQEKRRGEIRGYKGKMPGGDMCFLWDTYTTPRQYD